MFRSLKVKLTLAFGSLVVLIFVIFGLVLIDQESRELSTDIRNSSQSFAQLSSESLMQSYFNYLEPGNFVPFRRELSRILRQNEHIEDLSISSYNGVVLFNAEEEESARYNGTLRTLEDSQSLTRVQSNHVSLLTESGELVYLKINDDSTVDYVNENEEPVAALDEKARIQNIVVPYDNAYALIYDVSYDALESRLATAKSQIAIGALIGLILTLMLSFILSSSITRPLNHLKTEAIKLGKGDFKVRVKTKGRDEVGVLAETFNHMAKDLEAATDARVYQERVKKELELASQIQQELLPKEKLTLDHIDVAGGVIPASEVGGDAFDYIEMENGMRLFYLGDVTGHGVPAGIISSIANAMLYGLRGEKEIKSVVAKLNEVVRAKTTNNVFMTMAMTFWDEKKREVHYVNAGHPSILYYDAKQKKVTEVKQQGMALGFIDNLSDMVKPQILKLGKGDVIVMYSDGVPEAKSRKGEAYGMMRLKRIVQDAGNDLYTAEGIKNAVLSDVVDYIGSKEHDDDITVVVLKGLD